MTLEGVYDIQRRHRLPLRIFSVSHGVFDHILQKGLDHRSGFLVNLSRDPLHSASPRQSSDGWLGDSRDVSFAALSEPLSSALSQTFASFSSSRHIDSGSSSLQTVEIRSTVNVMRCDAMRRDDNSQTAQLLPRSLTHRLYTHCDTPRRRSAQYTVIAPHWLSVDGVQLTAH